MSVLIAKKDVVRKLGVDLDELIYKHDVIRLYQSGASTFTVEKVMDGEYYPVHIKSFSTLKEATAYMSEVI